MMDTTPRREVVASALLTINQPFLKPEPVEYIPPPLNLCTRKEHSSPEYQYQYPHSPKIAPIFIEPPTSSVCSPSPTSHTSSDTSEVSTSSEGGLYHSTTLQARVKPTRPFKAYPKDPMSLAIGATAVDSMLGKDSSDAYAEFRQKMLSQVQATHNGTNKNMRRIPQNAQNQSITDPTYWEKRRKNNEAAKRSRDARRAKEDEIAIRCAFLEQENMQLKFRIAALESERDRRQSFLFR